MTCSHTNVKFNITDLQNTFHLSPSEAKKLLYKFINAKTYENVDEALKIANDIIKGYGVEAINNENGYQVNRYYQNIIGLYINKGDTYDTTILYDTEKEVFMILSWGGWYEDWENKNSKECHY